MTLARHTSRIYMDELDVEGAITVLNRRIDEHQPCDATPYYEGAMIALQIILERDETRDQSVFMDVFDLNLESLEIEPIREGQE